MEAHLSELGAANISIFPQQRRLDVLGGRGFAQDVFKLKCYIEKKGLIKRITTCKI